MYSLLILQKQLSLTTNKIIPIQERINSRDLSISNITTTLSTLTIKINLIIMRLSCIKNQGNSFNEILLDQLLKTILSLTMMRNHHNLITGDK